MGDLFQILRDALPEAIGGLIGATILGILGLLRKRIRRPAISLVVAIIVGAMACGLLARLWWTHEHIKPLNGSIGIAKQENIKISSPYHGENVRTGYVKVLWDPQVPKILEFYRDNVSIEKTSSPVLPGTRIYLNQPGEVEIKVWTPNGTIEDQVRLIVVGVSSFRIILKLTAIVLFFVTGWLVWRWLKWQRKANQHTNEEHKLNGGNKCTHLPNV